MDGMQYRHRFQEEKIKKALERNKSVLLLGPRQTGKTTLIKKIGGDLLISLVTPEVRQRYEKSLALLSKEINALNTKKRMPIVFIDEVQKVPQLLDSIQDIIDNKKANFIITGSSARKLRRGPNVNLLPGRVISVKLDPLTINESLLKELNHFLIYGSLPSIISTENLSDKETDLESYVINYLEEEIRAEAIVRNIGSFARFLELAASEAGNIINLRKLSQEIGVSHTTIASYYQILEDCLIIERIEPITKSKTRKKLTRSQKYLFFDLGVRRLAAQEGIKPSKEQLGKLFEQFIGIELIRCSRISTKKARIRFWRDPDGPEVDWVIEEEGFYTPIETKWTDSPKDSDIKHLKTFLSEYKNTKEAYLICQTPKRLKLDENIFAIPWQEVDELIL